LAEFQMMRLNNVMRFCLLFAMALLLGHATHAQQKNWVFLADKGPEATFLQAHPEQFLSDKALQRRMLVGRLPNVADLPVSATYARQLAAAGLKIHGSSRWINALSIETDLSLRELQAICPAVTGMQRVAAFTTSAYDGPVLNARVQAAQADTFAYGDAETQVDQLNLRCLHDRGFTGRDVLIAVFDAGFQNMDTIHAFDSLWQQGRVLTYYDFVNQDTTVFDEHNHGMNVISTIVAHLPGQIVGTAPHAMVALARTESVFSETHQEEDNWMMAVEWADSLGADVIQSSLGYTTFDAGQGDFTYADLDGNTTIISRAADMAAARGMIVVNSAGNEGAGAWHHISAPCDGDSVLCVGAADAFGNHVSFSGVGPSADGQVKPDVAALGLGTAAVGGNGTVGSTAGTSFAAPLMAGFAACLRQAHPLRTNMQIVQAIQQSGSQYANPDTLLGYGIPDACKADSILHVLDSLALAGPWAEQVQQILVFPNPATETLVLENRLADNPMTGLVIVGADGRLVLTVGTVEVAYGMRASVPLHEVAAGVYFVRITLKSGQTQVSRFVKE
jgi:serine protease AprX